MNICAYSDHLTFKPQCYIFHADKPLINPIHYPASTMPIYLEYPILVVIFTMTLNSSLLLSTCIADAFVGMSTCKGDIHVDEGHFSERWKIVKHHGP